MDFLQRIFSLPRPQKRMVSLFVDSFFLVFAFWTALLVRLDDISVLSNVTLWMVISIVLPISLVVFAKLGLYRAVLRYMGLQALVAIVIGVTVSTITLVLVSFYSEANIPRTVPLIYAAFSLVFLFHSCLLVVQELLFALLLVLE
ncbi:hypothetical protein TUM4641_22750 [Shewanella morhuae]|nr:hypothetical protein TUM4641_22750 [Shewanella morhuae]